MIAEKQRGLIGGSGVTRRRKGLPCSDFDTPLFLDPMSRPEDGEALAEFMDHDRLELEIGPGRGRFISDTAYSRQDTRFIAVEARTKYCRMVLRKLRNVGVENVRLIQGDIRELLMEYTRPASLDAAYLLFPDPWWKRRHGKRRVATEVFMEQLSTRIKPEGLFVFRSDVLPYVERMQEMLEAMDCFERDGAPTEGTGRTHRQMKCEEFGIPTWELVYRNRRR